MQCIVAPESTTERDRFFLVDLDCRGEESPDTFMIEEGHGGHVGMEGLGGIVDGTSLVSMQDAIRTERKSVVLMSLVMGTR